jgi:hypothetical protein
MTAIKLHESLFQDELRRDPAPARDPRRKSETHVDASDAVRLDPFTIEELGRMLSAHDDDSGDGALRTGSHPLPDGLDAEGIGFTVTVRVRFLSIVLLAVALGLGFAAIMIPMWFLGAAAVFPLVASLLLWQTTTVRFEPLGPGLPRESRRFTVTEYCVGWMPCTRTTEYRVGDIESVEQVRSRAAAPGNIVLVACGKRGTGFPPFSLYNGPDSIAQRERWLAFLGRPIVTPDYYLV